MNDLTYVKNRYAGWLLEELERAQQEISLQGIESDGVDVHLRFLANRINQYLTIKQAEEVFTFDRYEDEEETA